jgi:pimeloyl-ACP methyl ester carboxylesterase
MRCRDLPGIDGDKEQTVIDRVEKIITTRDGVRLAVRDYGSVAADHTVVLLHGLCLTQESWAIQIRHLRRHWGRTVRIISYDHRGHGRSAGGPMHTYRIDRLATDLADVLTALNVGGSLILAGHSMGGMTALAYLGAHNRPVEVQGLVLVATAAGRLTERGLGRLIGTPATRILFDVVNHMPRRATEHAITGLLRPVSGALAKLFGKGLGAVGAESSVSLATAAGFLLSLKEFDQYPTLTSIAANTIILSGGTDLATPAAHARDLAIAIPGATHLHRPNAGHMLLHETPHCVSAAINNAMGRYSPADRCRHLSGPPASVA